MDTKKLCLVLAVFLLLSLTHIAQSQVDRNGNGNGNNGNSAVSNDHNGDGPGNNGKGKGSGNKDQGSVAGNDNKGNSGNDNSGKGNTGSDNSGKGNDNKGNTGSDNSGKGNDNKGNTGKDNSGKGNDNKGNDNSSKGKDDKGKNDKPKKEKKDKKGEDKDVTHYNKLSPVPGTGQERAFCKAKGACYFKTLTCPAECPERKPKKNKKTKACFIHCGSKCEATCKWRKPKCDGYGSLCYDPRFVGGDGTMFYFHGAKGSDFAIFSDDNLHINAHLIGTRPQGRTRDFTWVQALSIMFDTHTLVLAAKRVSKWDENSDYLVLKWNGETINLPTDGEAEWKATNAGERSVVVERTDDVNTVRVTVSGLLELNAKVVPIGETENRVHKYEIPGDDVFAHLEIQFRFLGLSESVEGILGKTYQPGYVSPVKRGVAMPMMGGEDKYRTPSLYSPICKLCRFQRPSGIDVM